MWKEIYELKNQILVFKKTLKNIQIRNLLIIYIIFFVLIINYVLLDPNDINYMSYEIVFGNYKILNYNFISMLWCIFQSLLIIYIQYNFLIYEFENSFEFILLRKPLYIIFFHKIIVILFLNIIIKIFVYFVTYYILSSYYNINIKLIFSNLLFTSFLIIISILLFIVFRINYNKNNK